MWNYPWHDYYILCNNLEDLEKAKENEDFAKVIKLLKNVPVFVNTWIEEGQIFFIKKDNTKMIDFKNSASFNIKENFVFDHPIIGEINGF